MSLCQKKVEKIEEVFRHWEGKIRKITVINFSFTSFNQQMVLVEANRSTVLRHIDALKQTSNDTDEWEVYYKKAKDSLNEYKRNVQILCE